MDTFQNLLMGFSIALSPENLIFALVGSILGTVIGVLPGVGPVAGTAMLIPLTFQLPPTGAIIMLTSLYYGTQYGGTITSVLLNVPGEAASAVTCIEGYQMAKQGRGGAALSVAAIGSFIGGTVATVALVIASGPLTRMALEFGPVEFFALMVLGLCMLMGLAGKSLVKALMMGMLGLLLAMVGIDPVRGSPRFTFGRMELMDGVGFIPVVMGLFGIAEILLNAENPLRQVFDTKMSSLILSRKDIKDSGWPVVRGTVIGTFLGLVPGMTGSASSFLSYVAERKMSKHPDDFGTGVIEGVAGPETANNAHANAALIPLFTLGIPASPTVAVLMGAFLMNGLVPGPFLFRDHAQFVWAVIASFCIGNIILLILNLPLIPLWVKVLQIPYSILFALILIFMVLGAYSINSNPFDVLLMAFFGLVGYFLRKLDFPLTPAVLTLILGPLMEKSLRKAMDISQGDFSILWSSPISAVVLTLAIIVLISPMLRFLPFGRSPLRGEDAEV